MGKHYYVYILSNKKNGTLYIGMTNNLIRRIYEHKQGMISGFTRKHDLDKLVFYQKSGSVESAINREKQMKKWKREWKIKLIERNNPEWEDLYQKII